MSSYTETPFWTYDTNINNLVTFSERDSIFREESRSYYDVAGTLRFQQVNRDKIIDMPFPEPDKDSIAWHWGNSEEYRYDALGRRVMRADVQEPPHCNIDNRCESSVSVMAWDGDQLLYETRNAGSVVYIHAGGVDEPVGMLFNGVTYGLHYNWRGLPLTATDVSGGCTGTCAQVRWPGSVYDVWLASQYIESPVWFGSVAVSHRDGTGNLYRRNRYYDPASGQFTQADPIGIAGGLNLYGFAGGDPVNFSDPFGLCPIPILCEAIDVGFVLADLNDIRRNGLTLGSGLALGADLLATAIPAVPAGAGALQRTSRATTRVIGHYPEYVQLGGEIGGKFFDVPTDVYNRMSTAERWTANKKFLDRGISQGAEFRLATPAHQVRSGSAFEDEIRDLEESRLSI